MEKYGGLDPNRPIYRIIDFFAFCHLVQSRQLYVPQAANFLDENEGIDALIGELMVKLSFLGDGIGFSWSNHEEAIRHHRVLKLSRYISCWTQQADSVALWSLYSQDKCSVSIQTTIGKLGQAMDRLLDVEGKQRLIAAKPGERILGVCDVKIGPVHYRSLTELHRKVERFGRATDRLQKRLERDGERLSDRWHTSLQQGKTGRSDKLYRELALRPFFIKDVSYQHECEVRATVAVGSAELNEKSLASVHGLLEQSPKLVNFLSAFFTNSGFASYPKEIFVPVPDDFVESVRIDPRCPSHKISYIKRFSGEHRVPILEATSFGYLPRKAGFEFPDSKKLRDRNE
jgi:hypothetical protein